MALGTLTFGLDFILTYLVANSRKTATKCFILLSKIFLWQIKRHYLVCVTSKNDKSQTSILETEISKWRFQKYRRSANTLFLYNVEIG